MSEWKLRDTVMVLFMILVVGIMLLQMVQNDRLYDRVSQAIRLLEAGSGRPTASGPASSSARWRVPGAEPGGSVIIHESARPTNLNIITSKDHAAAVILSDSGLVYETLLERDGRTLEFKGLLAESWSVADDRLSVTFRIRPEARYSDGVPVTARDFVFAYRATMIPTMDCQRTQTYLLDCDGVDALDDHTVRFRWKKKYFKILEVAGSLPAVPRHLLDPDNLIDTDPAKLAERINAWDPPLKSPPPVASGPYLLESWDKPGNRVILTRNERYWGALPPLQQIIFRIITSDTTALQALKAGELDYMTLTSEQWTNQTVDPSFLERFHKLKYLRADGGYSFIGWNNRRPPFDDRRVRQAMSCCMPREKIVEKLLYNLRELANGPFSPLGRQANPDIGQWPFDPEKARALLAEAGFRDTDGDGILDRDGRPFEFEMSIPAGLQIYTQIMSLFQDELSRIGVHMRIEPYEWSVYVDKLDNRAFDACSLSWIGSVEQDPYQIWHSSSYENKGSNHVGYSNPEVDRLILEAREEFDEDRRNAICHRIHAIIFEDQPYTFMLTGPRLEAVSRRIQNAEPGKLGMDFRDWWVPVALRRPGG